jgi:mannan endo-1,6-alpha-mannosidase
MSYYTGNITNTQTTVGVLPAPYYWWEAGALWGAMLDYYHYTNDSSYNAVTTQALLSQVGPLYDYMVPWHQFDEGNDDQAFWGFAIMSAAEKGYPQPTIGNYSWVQLTENLWNTQVRRWDTSSCNGGLKWQIFPANSGYNYKNSISNGAFFQLSARLARFTGNQTYFEWANTAYDWLSNVGFIDSQYHIIDGAGIPTNCSVQNKIIWTYNAGVALYGAAALYNYTNGSAIWAERTQGFLNATGNFFSPFGNSSNIMYEPACETVNTCNNDQFSFKGYLARFMWETSVLAPFTRNTVATRLTASAQAAAIACSGGATSSTCGQKWYVGGYDGKIGVGQQMSALETIQGLLVGNSPPPLRSTQEHFVAAATSSLPAPVPTPTPTQAKTHAKNAASSLSFSFLLWGWAIAAGVALINMC